MVTQAAIALLFGLMRSAFPCPLLREVAIIHNGQALRSEDREVDGSEDVFASGGLVGKHTHRLHSGPFVVIGRKGSAGKVTYAPRGGWVTDTAYFAVPIKSDELHCKFLFYALKALDLSVSIISTAIPGINRTAIYGYAIPLPPLVAQVRIVEFLDAVSGKPPQADLPELPRPLVEQRRVVARIQELAGYIGHAHALRQQAREETGQLLKAARRAAVAGCGGEAVELAEVCSDVIDNLHSNPRYAEVGVPCVRSPDVGWGTLSLDGALRTDEREYRRRTVRGTPQPDDIVFVREGGGTGKCALVLPGQRFSLGQRVMMLRPDPARVLPCFLLHQLLSPVVQEEQIAPLCKGSASPHLNIAALKRFILRIPPLADQSRIVAHLDALEAQVKALKAFQAETAIDLAALLPAILNRAFKGELT